MKEAVAAAQGAGVVVRMVTGEKEVEVEVERERDVIYRICTSNVI